MLNYLVNLANCVFNDESSQQKFQNPKKFFDDAILQVRYHNYDTTPIHAMKLKVNLDMQKPDKGLYVFSLP